MNKVSKNMIVSVAVLVSVSMILMLFSGCAQRVEPEEAVEEPEEAVEEPEEGIPGIEPGTEVNVFVDGGINSVPFQMFSDKIEEESGIKVVLTEVAQEDVYTKLKNEFVAGTGAYDLVIYFPSLLPEFVNLGNIIPMDDYTEILDPQLEDIIVSYRELYCTYNDQLYSLPYDGDLHVYYYRKDLLEDETEQSNFKDEYGYDLKVPETWEEAKDFAEFFTRDAGDTLAGQTLESDFYGNGMLLARGWCKFAFMDRFTAYGGTYFDEDLNPMINSEAGMQAMADLKDLMQYAPSGVLSYGYTENRGSFLSGNLASFILWTDLFKFSYNADESSVQGDVGISHIPGAIIDGELNYKATMPFGRVMSITSTTDHPAEAYYVAAYMSVIGSQDFVLDPRTGEDPFRYSHADPEKLAEYLSDFSGTEVPEDDCKIYFDAIEASLENGYPDLSIPGSNEYMDVLDLNIHKALSGEITDEVALNTAAEEWNDISESMGFETQKQIWQSQLETWDKLGLLK